MANWLFISGTNPLPSSFNSLGVMMSKDRISFEGCHIVWISPYADWWRTFCVENNFVLYSDVLDYLMTHYNATIAKPDNNHMIILFMDESSLLQFRFSWIDK